MVAPPCHGSIPRTGWEPATVIAGNLKNLKSEFKRFQMKVKVQAVSSQCFTQRSEILALVIGGDDI